MSGRPARLRKQLIELLQQRGPMTTTQLADAVGRTRNAVEKSIYHTRDHHPGLIYIAGWQRSLGTGGLPGVMWAAGIGPDAARMPAMSRAEQNARYYREHKAELQEKQRVRRQRPVPAKPGNRTRVQPAEPQRVDRPPMSAMSHMVFAIVRPPARTVTGLVQTLRAPVQHAAAKKGK